MRATPLTKRDQAYINHVAIVLDASGSMGGLEDSVIKLTESLVADLAKTSEQFGQETRISLYCFNAQTICAIYDRDALRLGGIADHYRAEGGTALCDATMQVITDLEKTAQLHGDHSFLIYVLTDGDENESRGGPFTPGGKGGNLGMWRNTAGASAELNKMIKALPDNWTLATLVPNIRGVIAAKKFGFPAGNIAQWDATSEQGLEEAMKMVTNTNTGYMSARATGLRNTGNLFQLTVPDAATVKAAGITPLPLDRFMLVPVRRGKEAGVTGKNVPDADKVEIQTYVTQDLGLSFRLGSCFYELVNRERIQAQKSIAIMDNKTQEVYLGHDARQLLGLPAHEVRVSPSKVPGYTIFVESTSTNRHLVRNTRLLILK